MPETEAAWLICIDTGGTFTDGVGYAPDGGVGRVKILSSGMVRGTAASSGARSITLARGWGFDARSLVGFTIRGVGGKRDARSVVEGVRDGGRALALSGPLGVHAGDAVELFTGEEAPVVAARLLTGTPAGVALPPMQLRLATTRGTNALLTRQGARTALFVTRGFRDLLEIGTQQRPDLFALDVVKPRALFEHVIEVDERMDAHGGELRGLDVVSLARGAREAIEAGAECAAVALLHADRFPDHERRAAAVLRDAGFAHVVCSHEAAPFIKIVPRAQTAVVDAYLGPVLGGYLRGVAGVVAGAARSGRLLVLTSAGGLVEAAEFRAKDGLLSGPAGGVVGARHAARAAGFARAISFDMGGTSTDVARLDEECGLVFEHRVGDAHLVAPAVGVETVAAGGGSICGFDGVRLSVGPGSAGASPGPACYGAGGPLTLTDVNLLLGRLDASRLPIPIDADASEAALERLRSEIGRQAGKEPSRDELLGGLLRIAAERMAGAVRRVSAAEGYDPRGYALVAFGGAGGQHACEVAGLLGIGTVVVPADAGVLSATGLRAAPIERFAERQVIRPLAAIEAALPAMVERVAVEARERLMTSLAAAGAVGARGHGGAPTVRLLAALRLAGQESSLEVEFDDPATLATKFIERYRAVYGHEPEGRSRGVELVWLRAAASVSLGAPETGAGCVEIADPRAAECRVWFEGGWRDVPRFERASLGIGWSCAGPAMIVEDHGTIVVPPGWRAGRDEQGAIIMRSAAGTPGPGAVADGIDEVTLEVFTSRCESIAREMGEALRRTAVSTNVKERLDFSCAILDAEGELIVNAPHVPVHLGSLGMCVRSVRGVIAMGPGDVVVTNHPALGGSHLPDVTVITPIHDCAGTLLGYAASRAHHAEIGGTRPGSMPPRATRLAEEGVVIAPMPMVRAGVACYGDVERVLRSGAYPSRAVGDNLADMRAAAAANRRAVEGIGTIAKELGTARVAELFERIKARAHDAAAVALRALPQGEHAAEEFLDDGAPIRVNIRIGGGRAEIDFTGSGGVHPGNLNATPAIVRSAVIYVLRLLVRDPLPLNEGLMRAVSITLPPGMLNPGFGADAALAPAVAGGNVETSQRVVDTLLKALGVAACSQGTMNNVIFGTEDGAANYYETVCGGCGATPRAPGASAVHSHMTNTRITDPEILETRCAVRLELFEVRHGSGGSGSMRGGDGVVRAITFLAPSSLSVLTQHRLSGPYGCAGGGAGAPGRQRVVRASGGVITLAPIDVCEMAPGDTLILETPGGGGWGPP